MPPKVMAVVERTCDHAEGESLRISRPELAHTRAVFRRPDGTSRFRPRGSEIYTTQDLLDAEARLLDAARAMGEPSVSPLVAADVCSRKLPGKDHPLSADQAAAVQQIVVSGRVVDVLVGAAGTGKSTAMRGAREAWEREHGPGSVVGLAPVGGRRGGAQRRGGNPDREHHVVADRGRTKLFAVGRD